MTELGNKLFDLLSEALCLKPDHLRSIQCNEGRALACHYYPECPEPGLAIGITEHSDNSFLTIVAQDQKGGLQVLDQKKHWADVEPIPGALVVNIGDYLQVCSNFAVILFSRIEQCYTSLLGANRRHYFQVIRDSLKQY